MKNYILAKFSRQNNTTGFSLVELIVTMAITGIVLTIGGIRYLWPDKVVSSQDLKISVLILKFSPLTLKSLPEQNKQYRQIPDFLKKSGI